MLRANKCWKKTKEGYKKADRQVKINARKDKQSDFEVQMVETEISIVVGNHKAIYQVTNTCVDISKRGMDLSIDWSKLEKCLSLGTDRKKKLSRTFKKQL